MPGPVEVPYGSNETSLGPFDLKRVVVTECLGIENHRLLPTTGQKQQSVTFGHCLRNSFGLAFLYTGSRILKQSSCDEWYVSRLPSRPQCLTGGLARPAVISQIESLGEESTDLRLLRRRKGRVLPQDPEQRDG